LKPYLKTLLEMFAKALGYGLVPSFNGTYIPEDISEEYRRAILSVKPFTMTSAERIYALIKSTEYIIDGKIEGDFVECGVWKGGSIMAIIQTLLNYGENSRSIYLFDTFEGMPAPQDIDVFHTGESGMLMFEKVKINQKSSNWCHATLEEVQRNVFELNYPKDNIYFVKGLVEDTIPKCIPEKIALLRLDTDFYSSTKHELEFLYPKLVSGGVLIIDDYGCWAGCRKAVDEFFERKQTKLLLNRLDHTGYIGVKIN